VRELGGQVAFLGCGTRCNTSIHGVEELLQPQPPAYLLLPSPITYSITDARGLTQQVAHQRHNFAGVAQRYERLVPLLQPGISLWQAKVQQAEVTFMDAAAMWAASQSSARKAVRRTTTWWLTLRPPAGATGWRLLQSSEREQSRAGSGRTERGQSALRTEKAAQSMHSVCG
jgi:hypothetical protein